MKIVTSGNRYLDIDAYGGCVAYAELLNLVGDKAVAVSTAPLNESVTPAIRGWNAKLERSYKPKVEDEFILIDLSDPEIFDTFVVQDRVIEIIDHHMEFADYWHERLGERAQIEFIGAACTLVYEKWQQAGKLEQISQTSARLLIAGILDNTLNFGATITTERDRAAFKALSKYAHLPLDWPAQYFEECQQSVMTDLPEAIKNDMKFMEFSSFEGKLCTGQLVAWNAESLATDHLVQVQEAMGAAAEQWFINIVSIEEGKNYIVASDQAVATFLEKLLSVRFTSLVATTDRLWLRKEIMKQDLDTMQ
jgi:nanoRNase/pAp phosphatase (c-di-AMP/oligoRNAs hydrolase)